MKRGDVVIVAAGGGFGGKPRPGLIIQSDGYLDLNPVILALFTSTLAETLGLRLRFEPSGENGLHAPSDLMCDVLITARRDQIGGVVGRLSPDEMADVDRTMLVVLGLAG